MPRDYTRRPDILEVTGCTTEQSLALCLIMRAVKPTGPALIVSDTKRHFVCASCAREKRAILHQIEYEEDHTHYAYHLCQPCHASLLATYNGILARFWHIALTAKEAQYRTLDELARLAGIMPTHKHQQHATDFTTPNPFFPLRSASLPLRGRIH